MTTPSFPPVSILAAGKGTRMSADGTPMKLNKAVMPLGDKAIISHIIEKFPQGTRFVIAVGFLAHQVKTYVSMAHPDVPVTFVDVENFDGPGSGPGLSLLMCEQHLQEPFYNIPADTLFDLDLNNLEHTQLGHNWAGVGRVSDADTKNYTTFGENRATGRITDIAHKEVKPGWGAWNGLIYVHDYATFWNALKNDATQRAGEYHHTNGIIGLIESEQGLYAQEMGWVDVGTHALYRKEAEKNGYDFSKTDEAIYFMNGKVIKLFSDARAAANRVARANMKPRIFPAVTDGGDGIYSYDFQPGKDFYDNATPPAFRSFLAMCAKELWTPALVDTAQFEKDCDRFYRVKTAERVAKYLKNHPKHAELSYVNGERVTSASELLDRLDWSRLAQGKATFMHGDFNFGNIVYDPATQHFSLIDWRQDFAGKIEYGDMYYDLAKLYTGFLVNFDLIRKNLFFYEENEAGVWVDLARRSLLFDDYTRTLFDFVREQGLSVAHVEILAAVALVNMAPCHHAPYDSFLWAFSSAMLTRLANAPETAEWFTEPLRMAA